MYLVLSLLLLTVYLVRRWMASRNLPGGPPSIPFLGKLRSKDICSDKNWRVALFSGSLPFLDGKGVKGFTDPTMSKYGKVAKIDVGPFLTFYVINDFTLAKELFAKDITANRNPGFYHKFVRGDNGQELGIINTSGKRWTEQRRFALRSLKDFGFGRKSKPQWRTAFPGGNLYISCFRSGLCYSGRGRGTDSDLY